MLPSTAHVLGPDKQVVFLVPLGIPTWRRRREADIRLAASAPQLKEYLENLEAAIDEVCSDATITRIMAVERRLTGECFHCNTKHACHACSKVHFDQETEPECPPTTNPDCHLLPVE